MAEKAKTEVTGTDLIVLGGVVFLAVASLNYVAVSRGYPPMLYCQSRQFLDVMGVTAWYAAATYCLAVAALLVGCIWGFGKAVPLLIVLAVTLSVPEWLDQGFRLGRACPELIYLSPVPPVPPEVGPPPREQA